MADMNIRVDTALTEVPVNIMPLIDNSDFKTIITTIVYNSSGMDLRWNFTTNSGATTSTAVTPTTSGNYDWAHQGDGMYTIEIPASGGASINNDAYGFGWFTGVVDGVLPFRGPVIQFIPADLADVEDDTTPLGTAQTGDSYPIVSSGTYGNAAIKTQTAAIETDTQDIQTRIPAALISGRIDATVGAYQSGLAPLQPTVAGRTLDVTATGGAGIDWSNVENPTTSLALTGTTIASTQKVDIETIKTNPVVNGGTVTFPTGATLASTTNITAGTITTVTNLTNAPTAGDFTATMKTSLNAAVPQDSSGVTTLLSRIGGTITITGGIVSADVKKINAVTVNGAGVLGNEWGP